MFGVAGSGSRRDDGSDVMNSRRDILLFGLTDRSVTSKKTERENAALR